MERLHLDRNTFDDPIPFAPPCMALGECVRPPPESTRPSGVSRAASSSLQDQRVDCQLLILLIRKELLSFLAFSGACLYAPVAHVERSPAVTFVNVCRQLRAFIDYCFFIFYDIAFLTCVSRSIRCTIHAAKVSCSRAKMACMHQTIRLKLEHDRRACVCVYVYVCVLLTNDVIFGKLKVRLMQADCVVSQSRFVREQRYLFTRRH